MSPRARMLTGALALALAWPAATAQAEPRNLSELLTEVREGYKREKAETDERVAEFKAERDAQAKLLADAKARLAAEERRSEQLEGSFQENEKRLAELEVTLRERLGTLGEAFGVVRQVAGDMEGVATSSMVNVQHGERVEFLSDMARSRKLPSIENLRRLWFEIQREMTESGRIVRFRAPVVDVNTGASEDREVVRVGVFNVIADGDYLEWNIDDQQLRELPRQPASRHHGTVAPYEQATSGLNPFSLDPSRGVILSLLLEKPSVQERVGQGGVVGYIILGLGALAGLVGLGRLIYVFVVAGKVRGQRAKPDKLGDNPLGRVLAVAAENRDIDPESLELKLDEAILRETARLDRLQWIIKVVSVVAPLLGLLGTVTGMIATFQSITLFGNSDPKLMAGGISTALVTTMLGLIVAIPLVLLHAWVSTATKRIIDVIEEQSAGMVARRVEASGGDA